MATNYDEIYRQTPNALGNPTPAFVQFFEHYRRRHARVLDVGCGQGRDALFIARLGHRVTGVDISASGISGLLTDSANENLEIEGEVADILDYSPDGEFDVIVVDRTLHMLSEADRETVLKRLVIHVVVGGYLLIADEKSNIAGFRKFLNASGMNWTSVMEKGGTLFVLRTE